MRVLILSQYFWPESFPINRLVHALEAEGAHITVLTGQPNYPDGAVFAGYRATSMSRSRYGRAIDVFRVPIVPRGSASGFRLAINYLSFVLSASILGPWLLRGRGFDVVCVYAPSPIVQSIPGIVLKRVKRAKLVTWVQDLWPQSLETTGFVSNTFLLSLTERMVSWIYRRNDQLMGQSKAFVVAIQKLSGRTPVEYFPNPGESPQAEGGGEPQLVLPAGFNVVFAGNLGTVQSLDTVLDAATILRLESNVRFVFVGSGSRSLWLAEEVGRRGLTNVLLAGRFESAAMPGIFSQADALLVSLNRSEVLSQTIPSKVQAYLAAGRPILASLDGEGAELVAEAGAGYASAAEDAQALADNIIRLRCLAPEERARMGIAGRVLFDAHFQAPVLARLLLGRFRDLINAEPRSEMTNSTSER
ncbi:MAG TPA: glycosyltransferase family 4 protein [Gemmatimonadaceae bacterium]|nr:glycosyltransferase family 4 protein [Gemmatimonadaceae bacterium]